MVAGWQHGVMTVIKINAITVPRESGDELAQRFAARAGAVDDAEGFEGFELLKPWLGSESFAHGHRSAAERQDGPAPQPVARHSEVWSYIVAGGSNPR